MKRAGELERGGAKVLRRWVQLPSGKRVMSYRVAGVSGDE